MIKRILVPVDGSRLSESILMHVRRLLLRQDADVSLLRVLPGVRLPKLDEENSALQYLKDLQSRLCASGVSATYQLLKGDPTFEILSHARATRPSLIAMSTHGLGGLTRWVRGSVAEGVLRRAEHPLLMASPIGLDDQRSGLHADFRRILVPLDGSDQSAQVIPLVRELATMYESRVILFHAEPLPLSVEWHQIQESQESAVNLDRPRDALREVGVSVRAHTEVGPVAWAILHAIGEDRADLVAMTTHGRSGVSRWLFGSVAEKVLRHCPVPILVFPSAGPTRLAPAEKRDQEDLREHHLEYEWPQGAYGSIGPRGEG